MDEWPPWAPYRRPLSGVWPAADSHPSRAFAIHPEDGRDDVTHLASGRYVRIKHSSERFALLGLVDNVEHVAGVTP